MLNFFKDQLSYQIEGESLLLSALLTNTLSWLDFLKWKETENYYSYLRVQFQMDVVTSIIPLTKNIYAWTI